MVSILGVVAIGTAVFVLSNSSSGSTDITGEQAAAGAETYYEDWSNLIDGDLCVIDGMPQILSATGSFQGAAPRIVYMRTNGDVIMLSIPGNSEGVATRGISIKLASGTCG